jgi:hypothetical protein
MDENTAYELAELLAQEHERVLQEQTQRQAAEETASQLAVLLVNERKQVEREREARERAEEQAHELSTLILGDAPAEPTRFIPQRSPLRSVS